MADHTVKVRIVGEDDLSGTLDKIEKKSKGFGTAIQVAIGVLAAGAFTKLVSVAGDAIGALGDMVAGAVEVDAIRSTFDTLNETLGVTSELFLEDLRKASRGMVSDADLMQSANKFVAMGIAETAEEAAVMTEMATQLGLAMGEDATASMENFALMMANQSIPRLDSFGISSGNVRLLINELMEATEGLTREEAFNIAVMQEAEAAMIKVGEQGDSVKAKSARWQTAWANLKDEIGTALMPAYEGIVDVLILLWDEHGPAVIKWVEEFGESLATWANRFAPMMTLAIEDWPKAWANIKWLLDVIWYNLKLDFEALLTGIETKMDFHLWVLYFRIGKWWEDTRADIAEKMDAWKTEWLRLGQDVIGALLEGMKMSMPEIQLWLFFVISELIGGILGGFGVGGQGAGVGGQSTPAGGQAAGIGPLMGSSVQNHYNLTINSGATAENVRADFALMQALAGV